VQTYFFGRCGSHRTEWGWYWTGLDWTGTFFRRVDPGRASIQLRPDSSQPSLRCGCPVQSPPPLKLNWITGELRPQISLSGFNWMDKSIDDSLIERCNRQYALLSHLGRHHFQSPASNKDATFDRPARQRGLMTTRIKTKPWW
jgi:hypothetical protein